MESAVPCTKKRTAKPASVGVSYQITQYTTTDLGCETFYYSNFSTENNPIKYTDPDGESINANHVIGGLLYVSAGIVLVAGTAVLTTTAGTTAIFIAPAAVNIATALAVLGAANMAMGNDIEKQKQVPIITGSNQEQGDTVGSASISQMRSRPKGMPSSIDGIDRDSSGSRGDRHAHGSNGEWAVNEDGTVHDGLGGRIPKDAADFLKGKGFNIPEDRKPLPNSKSEGD
jgi:hypothetical protein